MQKRRVSPADDFTEGQIHETLVTFKGVGGTSDDFNALQENPELCRRVIELIRNPHQRVFPREDKRQWLLKMVEDESAYHRAFFGCSFPKMEEIMYRALSGYSRRDIDDFAAIGLEVHFLPAIGFTPDSQYPGWKIRPNEWFWRELKERYITCGVNNPAIWEGRVVLIDRRVKPMYENGRQLFDQDEYFLAPIMRKLRESKQIADSKGVPITSRFGVQNMNFDWEVIRKAIASRFGFDEKIVQLETYLEANVIPQLFPSMPRKNDGDSDTWMWFGDHHEKQNLVGGHSHRGGLADVFWHTGYYRSNQGGFRPIIVLGK